MDLQLHGKIALISAASKGIGKGVAVALSREGAEVIISSSNEERILQCQSEIERLTGNPVHAYVMNLSNMDSLESAAESILTKHNKVDILVTNGPGPEPSKAADLECSRLAKAIQVNFMAVVALCRRVLPAMISNRFGRIINLTSTTAKEPDPGMVLSNVTRAAVLAYFKTLSREVAPHGITVNAILTGGVMTDRAIELARRESGRLGISMEEFIERSSREYPVGYIATPEQFSFVIPFLASPLSMYITGIALPVDGGFMRGI